MRLTLEQIQTDNAKMKSYICQRIPKAGQRMVLPNSPDRRESPDGRVWIDLSPVWNDRDGWDLHVETNGRGSVSLRDIYDYFRRQDMTSWEWRGELQGAVSGNGQDSVRRPRKNVLQTATSSVALSASDTRESSASEIASLEAKLDKLLALTEKQHRIKDWYTISEVAEELGKAEFTVREWCRLGQCKASKTKGYRGGKKQWMISHEEKVRLDSEGAAPQGTYRSPSPKY